MLIKVAGLKDRADVMARVDMAALLSDIGFEDVDPDADEQVLFCVFHNDSGTRSFSVNLEKKVFHCFSPACGVRGSAISLYALWRKCTYEEACREISFLPTRRDLRRLREAISKGPDQASALRRLETITAFVEAMPMLADSPLAEVLGRRGISRDVQRRFGLRAYDDSAASAMDGEALFSAGLANVWRRPAFRSHPILFPFRRGRYAAFVQGRLAEDDPTRPKYLGARGTVPSLFNHDALSPRPARVFVTEGAVDAMSLEAVGLSPAVGVVGGDGLKPEWAEDFKGIREIYIASDHDQAGEEAVALWARILAPSRAQMLRLEFPAQFKDVNQAVAAGWRPS